MKRILITSLSLLSLGACSTIVDKQTQMVKMETPGASNAKCTIQNEDMKYVVYTGQTIEIMKSPNDLVVNCLAAGNREQTVHVKRGVNSWVFANVANGFVPGATYDYFSRGGFDYPDRLVVNFAGDMAKQYPLPEYHNKDIDGIHEYGDVEYMGPTTVDVEHARRPYILRKKESQYGGLSDDSLNYNAGNISRATPPSRSNVSAYDPTEEDK